MKAPSPEDAKCKFCRRRFITARGVKEHERHHCAQNPDRRPRKFQRSQCRHCGKGLRAHVAQVHPEAYARSRSVRAHRMKEMRNGSAGARKEEHKNHTRQREASSHALHSREGSAAHPAVSERHEQRRRSVSGRRFVNGHRCRQRSAVRKLASR